MRAHTHTHTSSSFLFLSSWIFLHTHAQTRRTSTPMVTMHTQWTSLGVYLEHLLLRCGHGDAFGVRCTEVCGGVKFGLLKIGVVHILTQHHLFLFPLFLLCVLSALLQPPFGLSLSLSFSLPRPTANRRSRTEPGSLAKGSAPPSCPKLTAAVTT